MQLSSIDVNGFYRRMMSPPPVKHVKDSFVKLLQVKALKHDTIEEKKAQCTMPKAVQIKKKTCSTAHQTRMLMRFEELVQWKMIRSTFLQSWYTIHLIPDSFSIVKDSKQCLKLQMNWRIAPKSAKIFQTRKIKSTSWISSCQTQCESKSIPKLSIIHILFIARIWQKNSRE